LNKSIILKENKNKAAIYKLQNEKIKRCYVGRSENLTRRLLDYSNKRYCSIAEAAKKFKN
jgi:hypothetical protein